MTIYRIYSDNIPDGHFRSSLIQSVIVVANSEEEAREIARKKCEEQFVDDFENAKIEIVHDNDESGIVDIKYFNDTWT